LRFHNLDGFPALAMHLDDCLIIDRRRSTIIFAGEFRFRDSFHLPLSSESSFEFGEDAAP